jgi:hypothetical protein
MTRKEAAGREAWSSAPLTPHPARCSHVLDAVMLSSHAKVRAGSTVTIIRHSRSSLSRLEEILSATLPSGWIGLLLSCDLSAIRCIASPTLP